MNLNFFNNEMRRKADLLENYARGEMPKMAAGKILRFIDGNFKAQGFQGRSFNRWKKIRRKGTILVKTGRLRRSWRSRPTGTGEVRTWSESKYAKVHNSGFQGSVNVRPFKRNRYSSEKIGIGKFTKTGKERTRTVHTVSGVSNVGAHTRKINVARRQMMPTKIEDAPVLFDSMKREVAKQIKRIFN